MNKLSIGLGGLIVAVFCIAGTIAFKDSAPTASPRVEYRPPATPSQPTRRTAKRAKVAPAKKVAEQPNLGWTFADVREAFHEGIGYKAQPGQGVNEPARTRWVASPTKGYIDKFDVYFQTEDDSDQFVSNQIDLAAYMVGQVSSSWTFEDVRNFIISTAARLAEAGRTEGKLAIRRNNEEMLMIALAEGGRLIVGIGVSAIDPETK